MVRGTCFRLTANRIYAPANCKTNEHKVGERERKRQQGEQIKREPNSVKFNMHVEQSLARSLANSRPFCALSVCYFFWCHTLDGLWLLQTLTNERSTRTHDTRSLCGYLPRKICVKWHNFYHAEHQPIRLAFLLISFTMHSHAVSVCVIGFPYVCGFLHIFLVVRPRPHFRPLLFRLFFSSFLHLSCKIHLSHFMSNSRSKDTIAFYIYNLFYSSSSSNSQASLNENVMAKMRRT